MTARAGAGRPVSSRRLQCCYLMICFLKPSAPLFQGQVHLELMAVTLSTKTASILFIKRLQQSESNVNGLEVLRFRVCDIARKRSGGASWRSFYEYLAG